MTAIHRPHPRLTIHDTGIDTVKQSFADDVREGLVCSPKFLRPRCFYDPLGCALYDAICLLDEYYPIRAETQILMTHAADIVAGLAPGTRLIELGSGTAQKTRHLLRALFECQDRLEYVPIDISSAVVEGCAAELLELFPGLQITGYVGDLFRALSDLGSRERDSTPTTILFLGSTIGNFNSSESRKLLSMARALLRPGETFLLGADLDKSADILVPAYDDALGVTAAFNKNLLARINRELGGHFDLDSFAHRARYEKEGARIEMHLESLREQRVSIDDLSLEVAFAAGESIHTESSRKFDRQRVQDLASGSGFSLDRVWLDRGSCYSFNALKAV